MLKIGITGGIGSGKTTVCSVWQSLGAHIINADAVAKELMTNDESVKNQLIDTFGDQTYHSSGLLNREFLAVEAFEKNRVEQLNNIVHPAVFKTTEEMMEKAEQEGYDAVVYEAAILFERGHPEIMDTIVLVLADERTRINRVRERDHVTSTKVESRIKNQQNFDNFENKADIIIRNNGSLSQLKKRAQAAYRQLLRKSD